jgi:hypothetical protein
MIGGPTRRLRHHTVEPELTEIDRVNEGIDRSNRVVLVDPVIQALWKQRRLAAIYTGNEAPHPNPPQPSGNPTIGRVFTQPGSEITVPQRAMDGELAPDSDIC